MTDQSLPRAAALRRARSALAVGLGLALFVTLFVDVAVSGGS